MSEPFDIGKMVAGWATGGYWGKLISFGLGFVVLGFVGFAIYKAYIKIPEPTTNQRAETIINRYITPTPHFGCATVKIYENPSNIAR